MRGSRLRLLAMFAMLAMLAAACGGDGSGDQEGGPTGATAATGATGATGPAELGGTLVISNWDAYMPENLIPDFEAATGVDVELAIHTTNEDIMGKITAQNGGGFHVGVCSRRLGW